MPVPTAYSEQTLSDYMLATLGNLATVLGWTDDSNYGEPVTDALLAYGETDITVITGATNIRMLRALARRSVWRAAVAALSAFPTFTTPDGTQMNESDYQAMALQALSQAEHDCQMLGADASEYRVGVGRIANVDDPYVYASDDDRHQP